MKENYVKQLRQLLEAEVDQAESLIAARSFSQEMQSMVEKLGRLMNEDLPAVAEQMRNSFGPDVATGFENQTTSVLQSVMDNLRDGKQSIDNSVAEISGGGTPSVSLDMESPEVNDMEGPADLDLDLDLETDDAELDLEIPDTDEEPLGRAKKESVQSLKNKIQEMRKIVAKAKVLTTSSKHQAQPNSWRMTESHSQKMSTEEMIEYLKQHHDKNLHQDYLNHINTFSEFVQQVISVDSIKTELAGLDKEKVEKYKKMDFSKAPPIVIGDGYILDGYHRATVAKALKIPTVKAYVGVKKVTEGKGLDSKK